MINWISMWARNIIVAVIVSTIIEMILPNNNSKKYVKIIIGIFIVYSIVEPFSGKLTDEALGDFILEQQDAVETSVGGSFKSNEIIQKNESAVIKVYSENLKNDMASRLKNAGYIADNVTVNIKNDNSYEIQNVTIHIKEKCSNAQNDKYAQSIVDTVKDIIVKVDHAKEQDSVVNKQDIENIKKLFKSNYNIDESNIYIS